jgi:hypothetical protein
VIPAPNGSFESNSKFLRNVDDFGVPQRRWEEAAHNEFVWPVRGPSFGGQGLGAGRILHRSNAVTQKNAPVENDERHCKAQKIKIPICLDAVVIVLVPFMRRLIPFPEFLEPTHQSGFRLFRKSHHPNLLALYPTLCIAWSR